MIPSELQELVLKYSDHLRVTAWTGNQFVVGHEQYVRELAQYRIAGTVFPPSENWTPEERIEVLWRLADNVLSVESSTALDSIGQRCLLVAFRPSSFLENNRDSMIKDL